MRGNRACALRNTPPPLAGGGQGEGAEWRWCVPLPPPPSRKGRGSVRGLLDFSESDDTTGTGLIANALEYLKLRGKEAGTLKFLEPGEGPLALDGVDDVRVYVLGPPRDPTLPHDACIGKQALGLNFAQGFVVAVCRWVGGFSGNPGGKQWRAEDVKADQSLSLSPWRERGRG
jgi:hypothetical protein